MKFCVWKKNVLFSRYVDFCVFVKSKSTSFKICDVIMGIAAWWKLNSYSLLLNPKYYQKEIGSNNSVLCDKHFKHVFGSMLETEN